MTAPLTGSGTYHSAGSGGEELERLIPEGPTAMLEAAWMPPGERLDGFLQAEKSKSAEAIDAEALDNSLRFDPRLLSAKEV